MEQILAGVSTRRKPIAVESVGEQVEAERESTNRSAVSRKFVAMTETALRDLLAADLTRLDLVALMHTGCTSPTVCVLSRWVSGSTGEPSTGGGKGSVANTPWSGLAGRLRDRGLDVPVPTDPGLLDGAKALSAAVKEVFDNPVIGRCQLRKTRPRCSRAGIVWPVSPGGSLWGCSC